MNNQTKYQILKNFQQSLMKIADELSAVRQLSPRDEGIVQANLGRIQGLAQNFDLYVEQYNPEGGQHKSTAIGFQLVAPSEDEYETPEEDRKGV